MRRICLGLAVVLGCILVQRPAVAELYDDFEGEDGSPLDPARWTVTMQDFTVEQLGGEAAFRVTKGYSASYGQAMTPDTYDPDEGVIWSVELRNLGGDTPKIYPFIFESPAGTLHVYVRYGDSAFVVEDADGVSTALRNDDTDPYFRPSSNNTYSQYLTVGLDDTYITATLSATTDGVNYKDYTASVEHYLSDQADRKGALGMEVYGGEAGALKDVRFDNVIIQPIPEPPPFLDVYLDVKPGSWPNPVNLKSKGVLPVAICGTEAFDVESIDPTSVRLTRDGMPGIVIPIRWSIEDVGTPFDGEPGTEHPAGPDGIPDLVLKFDTEQVVVSLLGGALPGDEIELLILGNLAPDVGDIAVEGADGIIIVGGNKNYPPRRGCAPRCKTPTPRGICPRPLLFLSSASLRV